MSFKYINPGIAHRSMINNYTNTNYYSGLCLANGSFSVDLPPDTKEVYVLFQGYVRGFGSASQHVYAKNGSGLKTGLWNDGNTGADTYMLNNQTFSSRYQLITNTFHVIFLHIVSDSSAGVFTSLINGQSAVNRTGINVLNGEDITQIGFESGYDMSFSGIIISDEPISPAERVCALPVSATNTTMQDNGNGTYTATAAGQTVMQTVDAASLAATIGEASKITGICAIVNPAYYDGDGLSSIKAMKGEAEQGSFALSTDTTGAASASWKENDISISDLGRMNLGWKSAT